jgi:type I restriction enzyme, S subunit
MKKWSLRRLGEIANFINGDRSSSYPKNSDYITDGIPFLSAADIGNGMVNLSSAKSITEDAYRRLKSGHVGQGDILYCLRGSLGKMSLYDTASRAAIASSLVIIRP